MRAESPLPAQESTPAAHRIKVMIRCRKCGETFILRGTRDSKGNIETGFKRCLCDNDKEFDIEVIG